MIIYVRPFETVVKHNICSFHKKYPDQKFPGCTCSTIYTSVEKNSPKNEKTYDIEEKQ